VKTAQTCSLLLRSNPDKSRAIPCEVCNLPLLEPQDYVRRAAYEHANTAPVLVNNRQYYALLAALAQQLWLDSGAQTRLFIQVRMPSIDLALPASLLDPRVVMGTHLWNEALFWAGQVQTPVVWITADRIRRDLWDGGDNLISIASWNTDSAPAIAERVFPALARFTPQIVASELIP
jgi:hypothetical protein